MSACSEITTAFAPRRAARSNVALSQRRSATEQKLRGQVELTRQEIERERILGQRQRNAYFAAVNHQKENLEAISPGQETGLTQRSSDWFAPAWQAVKRWLGLSD